MRLCFACRRQPPLDGATAAAYMRLRSAAAHWSVNYHTKVASLSFVIFSKRLTATYIKFCENSTYLLSASYHNLNFAGFFVLSTFSHQISAEQNLAREKKNLVEMVW